MKKTKWVWIALLALVVLFGALSAASAATGAPGSESDPVVTKSYVDKTVKNAAEAAAKAAAEEAAGPAAEAAVEKEIDALTGKIKEELEIGAGTASANAFIVENVPTGMSLIGAGGTEIIVRSGQAKAIDGPDGGLCDMTQGADLATGSSITNNHLLLCPRDDGRGVFAATELWVMVRGAYDIR